MPRPTRRATPGYDFSAWQGLFAPSGTPPDVVERLARAVTDALGQEDVRARLAGAGFQPLASTRAAFAASLAREQSQWAEVVRRVGLKVE